MTSHHPRPDTMTALIASLEARLSVPTQAPTPDQVPDAVPAVRQGFTVTAYVNVEPHSFFGFQSGHAVAEVTTFGGVPLRLVFTSDRVVDDRGAANAAFVVGNRHASDDHGQDWPADVRSLSVGDVLEVTAPDETTTFLAIDSVGFSEVQAPVSRTNLVGTRATSRTT